MLALAYKLKHARGAEFLSGVAESVETDEHTIRLRRRVIPLAHFEDGRLVQVPQELGDLELPLETWAVWTYAVEVPWLSQVRAGE